MPELHKTLFTAEGCACASPRCLPLKLLLFCGKRAKLRLNKCLGNNSSERPETTVIQGAISSCSTIRKYTCLKCCHLGSVCFNSYRWEKGLQFSQYLFSFLASQHCFLARKQQRPEAQALTLQRGQPTLQILPQPTAFVHTCVHCLETSSVTAVLAVLSCCFFLLYLKPTKELSIRMCVTRVLITTATTSGWACSEEHSVITLQDVCVELLQ